MTDCKCPLCEAGYPLSNKSIGQDYYKTLVDSLNKKMEDNSILKALKTRPMHDLLVADSFYDVKTDREGLRKSNMGLSLIMATYSQTMGRSYRYPDTFKPVIWDIRPSVDMLTMEPFYLVPDLRSSTTLYRPLIDGLHYLRGDFWSMWMLTTKLPEDRFSTYKKMYQLWVERFESYYMPLEMGMDDVTSEQVRRLLKSIRFGLSDKIIDESHYLKGSVRYVEDIKPFYQKQNETYKASSRFGNSFKS